MTSVASPSSTAMKATRRSSKSPTDSGSARWTSTYWSCIACRSSCASTIWLDGVMDRSTLTAYSFLRPGRSS